MCELAIRKRRTDGTDERDLHGPEVYRSGHLLFGLIPARQPSRQWAEATRLRVGRGVIAIRGYVRVPPAIMSFISDRADRGRDQISSMSPQQHALVRANLERQALSNPDAEVFQALRRDIELFGFDAVKQPSHKPQDA
jgi:hypothetical protein